MRLNHLRAAAAASLGVAALCGPAIADIINVPGDQPTIQAGIDAALNGDEVVVAPGTYNEFIDLLGKAITVRSSGGAAVTTIDSTGTGQPAVRCDTGETSSTVIDAFTVIGFNNGSGGGMVIDGSSPTVSSCAFVNCQSLAAGGGIFVNGGDPTITACTFNGCFAASDGGGISIQAGDATITACTFSGCATNADGGGIALTLSSPDISQCHFEGNTASNGGGLSIDQGGPTVLDCEFRENDATNPFGGGGGVLHSQGTPMLTNCTLARNTAVNGAGALVAGGTPTFTDCTFTLNIASSAGGGIGSLSTPLLIGSFFCLNVPDQIFGSFTDGGQNILECPDPAPTGACCLGPNCIVATSDDCLAAGGVYQGNAIDCGAAACPTPCPGDVNEDGAVDILDLLILLGAWGACP